MSFREVAEPLRKWSAKGLRCGVATLVRVQRSAPRPPGARFAANEKGELAGSVSSGCVEGDLLEHIQQVIAAGVPRTVHYGISDEMAADVGLSCGGEIDVLVEPYPQDDRVWQEADRLIQAQDAGVLVTRVSDAHAPAQLLLRGDGTRVGTLGDSSLDERAAQTVQPLFDTGGSEFFELEPDGGGLFAEAFLPPARLAIIGATPVAAALCHLAHWLGLAVTVIDPRKAFADPAQFPEAREVLRVWPDEGLGRVLVDRYWNVVVLAHDQKLDVPALAAALRAGCLYVGQIGGKRTQRMRREALQEQGFGAEQLDRIHGPVGLDIGAESPHEIALSIMAELLAVRRGKRP